MIARIRRHRSSTEPTRSNESGQVLPLFALMLVVLLGFAALAVDVTRAYADLRFYRATADAAALAGAQDLQVPGTRNVTPAEQTAARSHALQSLEQSLGGTGTGCVPSANIVGCALLPSPYVVAIKTPSPSCSSCDPLRSVQVTVRHPNYGLTFARVLGSDEWDVGTTSIAGLVFGRSYAIITLRPPKKLGATFDVKDIRLNGTGTIVNVHNGDVGTNANMEYAGLGSVLNIDPGWGMYYFDPLSGPLWSGPPMPPAQIVQKLRKVIKDPNYRYPCMGPSDPGELRGRSCQGRHHQVRVHGHAGSSRDLLLQPGHLRQQQQSGSDRHWHGPGRSVQARGVLPQEGS